MGFERPKNWSEEEVEEISKVITPLGEFEIPLSYNYSAYSIGELIEMLPMEDRAGERSIVYDGLEWVANWDNDDGTINQVVAIELIDALYDMLIKLKEKGVI